MHSGIGWKGKNELIVNPRYGCAIRLASIVTETPLEPTYAEYGGCGDCDSCLKVCSFLRQKDNLPNFREQCRKYMLALELDQFVCGKCIKACSDSPGLTIASKEQSSKNTVLYTE
jgi:epoxyqueuosine reductase QueG